MKAILLNRVLIVLSFVGLFIAGVLSLEAGLDLIVPCGSSGGCAKVANDPSSHFIFGIPNAYLGVLGYVILAGLGIARSMRPVSRWKPLVSIGYAVASVGTLFSIGLQYYSLTQIRATCMWCLSSAITMVVILILYAMLAQDMENLPKPRLDAPEVDPENAVVTTMGYRMPRADQGMLVGLPLVVIIGLALMGASMKGGSSLPPLPKNFKDYVPKDANILGVATSPVTVVEFADLCCPACQRTSPLVKEFVLQHPGKIRLVYRHYPLPMHQLSEPAAVIAECMADDNRFWEFAMGVLSLNRQPNSVDELLTIAEGIGGNKKKIMARIENTDDPAYARVERDLQAVKALGITSTPTFFILLGDKVQEVAGPSEILDDLKSSKYKAQLGGASS